MSSPTSLKMDPPTPTDAVIRRRFLWLYFIIIWISLLPLTIIEYFFFKQFIAPSGAIDVWMWILLPWDLLGVYYLTVVWAAYVAKFFLLWVNLVHKPREGVFARSPADKDYRYFHLRNLIRKFALWILYSGPFPWLKEGWMHRRFGAKIGKNVVIHDAFLSLEFVELGDNVILGLGTVVMSHWYEQERFILGHVTIGKDAIIGSKAVILPLTTVGEGAVVDAESMIVPGTEIKAGDLMVGKPAVISKIKEIAFSD